MNRPDLNNLFDEIWTELRNEGFSTTVVSSSASSSKQASGSTGGRFGQVLTEEKLRSYLEQQGSSERTVTVNPEVLVTPSAKQLARDRNVRIEVG